MANSFVKADKVVDVGLQLLLRETVFANTVWRDAAGDFRGARGDSISIRVPAYAKARTRSLRSGDTRIRDSLNERKVVVSLDTDVYKDVRITDEELTLDIMDFGRQVLTPVMRGIVEQLEQEAIDNAVNATYQNTISFTYGTDDVWKDLILPARELLNKSRVPQSGRTLAVGAEIETAMLETDLFVKANESGSTTALREATVDRKAGFNIISVPGLPIDEAYAYHRTAYVLSSRAPMVPQGAPWGAVRSLDGFAMRAVQVLDSTEIENILAVDSYVGANVVTDSGSVDADGIFVPAEDPDETGESDLFVRAVQITASS